MLLVAQRRTYLCTVCAMAVIAVATWNISCSDSYEGIGSDYTYVDEGPNLKYIRPNRAGEPEVPCTVISYADDERYIVAIQKADKDCSSTINVGRALNFWIIDRNEKKSSGPLSFEDYLMKRREFGVPDSLTMQLDI